LSRHPWNRRKLGWDGQGYLDWPWLRGGLRSLRVPRIRCRLRFVELCIGKGDDLSSLARLSPCGKRDHHALSRMMPRRDRGQGRESKRLGTFGAGFAIGSPEADIRGG